MLINRKPLTKPRAIEIIREVLGGFTGGTSDYSLPTPTDSSGMEEIQLDSIELMEFTEQLKRKSHVLSWPGNLNCLSTRSPQSILLLPSVLVFNSTSRVPIVLGNSAHILFY